MAKAKTTKSTPKRSTKKSTSTKKTTPKKSTTKKTTTAKSTSKSTKATKPKSTSMKTPTPKSILMRSGIDSSGNQQYTEYKVYNSMPKNWKETRGATTAPNGFKWINNGKSLFSGERKNAFLKVK